MAHSGMQLQSCVAFENYITKQSWSVLLDTGVSMTLALQTMRDCAAAVGIFHPNEPTCAAMTAIIAMTMIIDWASMNQEDWLTLLHGVQDIVRAQSELGKLSFAATPILFYPPSIEEFKASHPALYAYSYPEEANPPNCCPLPLSDLQQLKQMLPVRRSRKIAPQLPAASAVSLQYRGDDLLTNLRVLQHAGRGTGRICIQASQRNRRSAPFHHRQPPASEPPAVEEPPPPPAAE